MTEPLQTTPIKRTRKGTYIRIAVTAACLAWIGINTNWSEVGTVFASIRITWWLTALGVLCVIQVASAARWWFLTRPFGFDASVPRLTEYYFVGMYFNLMLPTAIGGDVVRAWYLDGGGGRLRAAIATVLLDRCSGLVALLALACAGVLASPIELPAWIQWFVWSSAGFIAICVLVSARMLRRGKPLTGVLERVRLKLKELMAPKIVFGTTLLSFGVQAGNVFLVWLVGMSIAADIPNSYFWIMVPMVSLLTMLPVSINGMGVRENAAVFFLAPLGVADATAVSLSLLWFLVYVSASLLGGIVFLVGGLNKPNIRNQTPADMEVDHGTFHCSADQGRARQHQTAL